MPQARAYRRSGFAAMLHRDNLSKRGEPRPMYIPRTFREENLDELLAFMRAHSFITLVSILDGAPFASHVPVVVQRDDDTAILHGHLARANPHWQAFGAGDSFAIFTGPHAYSAGSPGDKV